VDLLIVELTKAIMSIVMFIISILKQMSYVEREFFYEQFIHP